MGWDVLLNESRTIKKNQQSIKLVGVENWGEGGFKKAGDLDKACQDVCVQDFTILMSHDPSHWQSRVKEHPKNIHLPLVATPMVCNLELKFQDGLNGVL